MKFVPRDFHRNDKPFDFARWDQLEPMLRERRLIRTPNIMRLFYDCYNNRFVVMSGGEVINGICIGWAEYDEAPLLFSDMHQDWTSYFKKPSVYSVISDSLMKIRNQTGV